MHKLNMGDFEKVVVNDKDFAGGYFSCKKEDFELCLEPCLNGFCVGVYDSDKELIYPKKCTDLNLQSSNVSMFVAFDKALDFANKFLMEYNKKHKKGGETNGLQKSKSKK